MSDEASNSVIGNEKDEQVATRTTFKAPNVRMKESSPDTSSKRKRTEVPPTKGDPFSPDSWERHFDDFEDVQADAGGTFRVYTKGSGNTVVLLLHGLGLSSLSFAVFASRLCQRSSRFKVIAMDFRGHGGTTVPDQTNYSKDVICQDVAEVVGKVTTAADSVTVMGHSFGGVIAVNLTALQILPQIVGLVVVDVVEGSAMEALPMMKHVIDSRPTCFHSHQEAIRWCVRAGPVKNVESAKVSMPPQLIEKSYVKGQETHKTLEWRVDLAKSEQYWEKWFSGLSALFLGATVPKLLILAGVNTLDVELTIGHMQGKFQLNVIADVGHAVHEDAPGPVADAIAKFIHRFKLGK